MCGNKNLIPIIDLGNQCLTGIFPKSKNEFSPSVPLELVKCENFPGENFCGLVQLRHSYDLNQLYGKNYGYRSGLNKSMVNHLHSKVKKILSKITLKPDDIVIDIGSNDSTLLKAYPSNNITLVGIDPTGIKFKKYYPKHAILVSDFFSANVVKKKLGDKKAKIITSIAMFYDLESPLDFMKEIYSTLADDGIWVFEQSYFPTVIRRGAYDTICHEHLEYYSLKQIKWMTDKIGFKIIDLEFNDVNGGSFSITVAKSNSPYQEKKSFINKILRDEVSRGLDNLKPYKNFAQRIFEHKKKLIQSVRDIRHSDETIFGYGASTKGNVVLQFCNITEKEIPYIAEVNEDKFGSYTPGTLIPIISEKEAKEMNPDYFLVLPWHFRDFIIKKEQEYLQSGGKLIFPLPKVEIVEI